MDGRGRHPAAGELMAQDYRYVPIPASLPAGGYRATAARREQARLQRAREAAWRRESEGLGVPVAEPGVLREPTGRRERPPTSWEMVGGPTMARAGGSLVEALDAPPSGMRETLQRHPDMPYTTPLRALNATTAVIPKAGGDALSTLRGTPLSETTIDPMAPVDEQTNWVSELQHQGVPDAWAVGLGTTADFLLDPMDWATGGAAGLATLPATLARIPKALRGGFMSRVDDAINLIPVKGAHPNKVSSLLSRASKEELEYRGVPAFLAAQGNTPVTREALRAHLQAHPAPFPEVKTKGRRTERERQSLDLDRLAYLEAENAKSPLGAIDDRLGEGTYEELLRLQNIRDQSSSSQLLAQGEALEGRAQRMQQRNPREARQLWDESNHLTARNEALELHGMGLENPTTHGQYQVPGGENYRETVLTLPEGAAGSADLDYARRVWTERGQALEEYRTAHPDYDELGLAVPEYRELLQANNEARDVTLREARKIKGNTYKSDHFDEPNILAHTRANERTLPSGERGRFLEEVQSDWHQTGKEKGYRGESLAATFEPSGGTASTWRVTDDKGADLGLWHGSTADEAIGFAEAQRIPDAPFKDSWQDLGFKQQLLEVADDPTLDWIGFTSGKTQTDRWGSERLTWEPVDRLGVTGYRVRFEPQVGGNALGGDMGQQAFDQGLTHTDTAIVRSEKELSNLLGGSDVKAAKAWKRIQSAPEGGAYLPRAEGMVEFYDRLLPKRVAKIVKPFGGTVEQVSMGAGQPDQWIVRLTPEMKAKIKQGLPLLALPAGVRVADESRERRRN